MLVVLSGPSGAGKGTICRELLSQLPEIRYSVSVTTRSPRAGEKDGVDYYFVSRKEFEEMVARGAFLEWAQVYDHFYGTPREKVEEYLASGYDVLLEIDTQGASQVKERFPAGVFIFVCPPSLQELAVRIAGRGTESPEDMEIRLRWAENELKDVSSYDYVVVNDVVKDAVEKIKSILTAEKCRCARVMQER